MLRQAYKISVCGAVAFAIAGCSTQVGQNASRDFGSVVNSVGSGGLFNSGYLSDTSDVCLAQRQEMADKGSLFDPEVLKTALLGAGSGGLLAALSGENVLAGAAIGAGLGLAAGYLNKLQKDGLNGTQIASRARDDIRTENRKIDELIRAFDEVSDCRKNEGKVIQRAYNKGDLKKADAQTQMAEVRERFAEDRAKFKEIAEQISDKSENNAAIYNDIAADSGGNALEVKSYRAGKKSAKVRRKTATKQAGTEEGSLKANNKEVKALQRECLTNVKKRDDCFDKVAEAEEVEGDLSLDLS